jgi:hypothetical protein
LKMRGRPEAQRKKAVLLHEWRLVSVTSDSWISLSTRLRSANLVARLSARTPSPEANDVPHPLSAVWGRGSSKDLTIGSCRDETRFFHPQTASDGRAVGLCKLLGMVHIAHASGI